MLYNFIRDEQQSDPILEAQDLELLFVVDDELTNQQMERVQIISEKKSQLSKQRRNGQDFVTL